MNLLDDSLSADLARSGGLDAAMTARFVALADYAVGTGAQAILFTCSAFGPCIDEVKRRHAALPVLKPNEAMVDEAVALGRAYRAASAEGVGSAEIADGADSPGGAAVAVRGQGGRDDRRGPQGREGAGAHECSVTMTVRFSLPVPPSHGPPRGTRPRCNGGAWRRSRGECARG